MKKPTCILVPVDYSESSLAALDFGMLIAEQFHSQLMLLTVEQPEYLRDEFMIFSLGSAAEIKKLKETVQDRARAVKVAIDKEKVKALVESGDVVDQIVKTAQQKRADMIVMGTHGRSGIMRAALGSVTEETIRRAPCPVLAIRADMPLPKEQKKPPPLAPVDAKKKWLSGE